MKKKAKSFYQLGVFMIAIGNEFVAARINALGAELASLRDASGHEYIWQAGPAWPRHSPVLFPIVGQVNNDTLRVDGREYHMGRHGFARDREFTPGSVTADHASFVLADDDATRAVYPFAFRLTLEYRVTGAALRVRYLVENPGPGPLPFSLGAHPAFNWPLPKQAQQLVFDRAEPAPVRRLADGLLAPEGIPTPIQGRTLPLSDELFVADALILDQVASRGVAFGKLRLTWCEEMRQLGIWSKPGADFLCIEPWAGHSDPVGYAGEFRDKPAVVLLPPAAQAAFWWEVAVKDH